MSDPYNFPMPNRADTMALSSINKLQDQTKINTRKFDSIRNTSNNLLTQDIECANPKLHGSKKVSKPEFSN